MNADTALPVAFRKLADGRRIFEGAPPPRKHYIGGSDAAAILGHSPWRTKLDAYLLKRGEMPATGREEDPAIQDLLETGKEMEPVIINRTIRRYKLKVVRRSTPEQPNYYVDPEFDFMAAEIDFEWLVRKEDAIEFDLPLELVGTIQNGEVKKVHQFATAQFGEAETDQVPIQYAAQAMHGLMVSGRQLCMFAVQLGDQLNIYWVKRDDEIISGLRALEVKFWCEHVLAGVAPEPVNLPDVMKLFRKVLPIDVAATNEVAGWFEDMEKAKDQIKAAEEAVEDFKYKIGVFMLGKDKIQRELQKNDAPGDVKPTLAAAGLLKHRLTWCGRPLLSVDLQSQSRTDSQKLKRLYPDVAADCSKATSFFVFRPSKE